MLTTAQQTILNTAIQAETDPSFIAMRTEGAVSQMSEWFNSPSTKVVWRTRVSQDEIMQNGFDWVQVDNLTVGKARIWEWLFDNQSQTINPSKPNVRAGIDESWKGTSAMLAVRASIYLHCKRFATRAEALFATGIGNDENPASVVFEGQVSDYDIVRAIDDNKVA